MNFFENIYKNAPNNIGVYIIKDINNEVIYIGKAINIRKRLASYLKINDEKTLSVVKNTFNFEYILTNTESEALILEANLIKKYQPKYNILLKDDKNYSYIAINKSKKYPNIEILKRKNDKYHCFGPYTSKNNVKNILNILNKVFLTRKCKDNVFKVSKKPCVYYQIKTCLAPCVNYINKTSYDLILDDLFKVLKGKTDKIIEELSLKMIEASNNLNYEEASVFRDKISSLKILKEKQNVVINSSSDIDLIHLKKIKDFYIINILIIRNGVLLGQNNYLYPLINAENELIESFLSYYYSINGIPKNLYFNFKVKNKFFINLFKESKIYKSLKQFSKLKPIIEKNMDNYIRSLKIDLNLKLASILKIKKVNKIECYDMSNIAGSFCVGAMVVFVDGIKIKNLYRKYKIKVKSGSDDLKMMQEVISRRFKNCKDAYPDIVLIDGGKSHINAIKNLVKDSVAILAIAKEKTYKDKVYYFYKNNIIKAKLDDELVFYLMKIRDEAHRYVNYFHKNTRNKYLIKSILENISGLKVEDKIKLLKKYPNIFDLNNYSEEKLSKELNINKTIIKKIKNKILLSN